MTIKSSFYFDDNKLWVAHETWIDLIGAQSSIAIYSLKAAAEEILARGGAFIIYDDSVGIIRRCDRIPELEALMRDVDASRGQLAL